MNNNQYLWIFISESSLADSVTEEIMRQYPQSIQKIVPDGYDFSSNVVGVDPKKILFLTRSKGDVVKACPGTDECYLCCRYQVINQTQNCPMNCTYCILQFYLNQPATTIYTNFDEIFSELKMKIARQPQRFFRIGTGELGDSLAVDGSVTFAKKAVEMFADIPNAVLELKSKTTNIDDLLSLKHNQHTVLAWSVNPQDVTIQNEINTAPLMQRLIAAGKAADAGFLIAFHFDPILHVPDWEMLYGNLVNEIYHHVNPARIAWISMGSLRFPPSMKEKIIARYPYTPIPYAEMVRGMDGKMRYARPLRVPMYRLIYQKLSSVPNPPFIYFCMESPLIWQEVFGFVPENNAHLDYMFAESLYRRFPGLIQVQPHQIHYQEGFHLDEKMD